MAPAEVSEATSSYPLSHLKVLDRAMQFPIVSDTVGEVAKYAETIRSNNTVQSASNMVQSGFKSFTDLKPVVAVKDAVLKSSTISGVVLPRMTGAVESLDSLVCNSLDQLKAAVPAIAEPTPQLLQTTKKAASGYWSRAVEYVSSFTVSQMSLGLAGRSLDVVSTVVGKVASSTPSLGSKSNVEKAKHSAVDRLQEGIGGVRQAVQDLKKRGEPQASDLGVRLGLLTAAVFNALHLPAIFGFFGVRLEAQEGQEVKIKVGGGGSEEKATELSQQGHQSAKRSAETETESSDDD